MIKAVIFDAFGTLLEPVSHKGPYQRLSKLLPGTSHLLKRHELMTVDRPFSDFLGELGDALEKDELLRELDEELASITPYSDSVPTIVQLKKRGMKVGVCSNLAQAYGGKVRELLKAADEIFLSYEIGHIKPSPAMYDHVVRRLRMEPADCLFIGDNQKSDVKSPIGFGMHAFEIDRRSGAPVLLDQIDRFMAVA